MVPEGGKKTTHLRVELSRLTSTNSIFIVNNSEWNPSNPLPASIHNVILNFNLKLVRCQKCNGLMEEKGTRG